MKWSDSLKSGAKFTRTPKGLCRMKGSGKLRAYLALCDLMNNDSSEVWFTRSSIAEHMGVSDKAARKAIRLLIEDGLVESKKARNRRGEWLILHTFKGGTIEPEQNDRGHLGPEQSVPDGGTFGASRRNKTTDQLDSALDLENYTQTKGAREVGQQPAFGRVNGSNCSKPRSTETCPYCLEETAHLISLPFGYLGPSACQRCFTKAQNGERLELAPPPQQPPATSDDGFGDSDIPF